MTAIQERIAAAFQARVGGLVESMTAAASGLGIVCGGLIATLSSPRAVYVLSGLAILACAAVILSSPRTVRAASA